MADLESKTDDKNENCRNLEFAVIPGDLYFSLTNNSY
jgi:hypothetical protein